MHLTRLNGNLEPFWNFAAAIATPGSLFSHILDAKIIFPTITISFVIFLKYLQFFDSFGFFAFSKIVYGTYMKYSISSAFWLTTGFPATNHLRRTVDIEIVLKVFTECTAIFLKKALLWSLPLHSKDFAATWVEGKAKARYRKQRL